MKNYEKYADEIRELKSYIGTEWCDLFAKPKVLKPLGRKCEDVSCGLCNALATLWLLEDYEEPEVDWSQVKIDTPILVRDSENTEWLKKYFAKYENGHVYVWNNGRTSWSATNDKDVSAWPYAKLAESDSRTSWTSLYDCVEIRQTGRE